MPDQQLITSYLFKVTIPGIDEIGYFSRCEGLELSFEVYEYREGGNNELIHRLPGALTYPNLTLSRGLTNQSALLKWFSQTQTEAQRKEVTLTLSGGEVERSWTFAEAFPVRWVGPQITGDGTGVASETLEIAHAGLKLV